MNETLDLIADIVRLESRTDSLEIGTPSKGGAIKIYGDFSKVDEFVAKIENAKRVRERAQELLGSPV